MQLLLGKATLMEVKELKRLAQNCRDGSQLVDKVLEYVPDLTHEDHMAILSWWHKTHLFADTANSSATSLNRFRLVQS